MNREIKFRIWYPEEKRMVFKGALTFDMKDGSWLWEGRHGSFHSHFGNLMQFTGLKDKNGKEIYEGDIVKAEGQDYRYLQIIEFHNTVESCGRGWIGRNVIRLETIDTPRKRIDDTFSYFCWPAAWEIIGNIYENPELIN